MRRLAILLLFVFATALPARTINVQTKAAMATARIGHNDVIVVATGGRYRFDATSSATVNGDLVVNGPASIGRYLLIPDDKITVKNPDGEWFIGETEASRRTAFANAVASLTDGSIITIPKGEYVIPETTISESKITWIQFGKILNQGDTNRILIFSGDDNVVRGMHIESTTTNAGVLGTCFQFTSAAERNRIEGFRCDGTASGPTSKFPYEDDGTDNLIANLIVKNQNGPIKMDGSGWTIDNFTISTFLGTHAISSNSTVVGGTGTISNGRFVHDAAGPNDVGCINMAVLEDGSANHFGTILIRNVKINRPTVSKVSANNINIKIGNTDNAILDGVHITSGAVATGTVNFNIEQQNNVAAYTVNRLVIKNSHFDTVIRGGPPIEYFEMSNVTCSLAAHAGNQTRFIDAFTPDSIVLNDIRTKSAAASATFFNFDAVPGKKRVAKSIVYDGPASGNLFDFGNDGGKDLSKWEIEDITLVTAGAEIVEKNEANAILVAAAAKRTARAADDVRSVVAFGADPTGVLDATSAIQSACDDIPSTGGKVFVPQGSYLVSGAISLKSGTTFQGAGRNKTFVQVATNGNDHNVVTTAASATNCRIADMTIRELSSNPRTAPTGTNGAMIYINDNGTDHIIERINGDGLFYTLETGATGVSRITIRDVHATKARNWGIGLTNATYCSLLNCTARDNGLDGFKLRTDCSYLRMVGCDGSFNGDRTEGAEPATNGNGIDLFGGGEKLHISNCVFNNNWGAGILVKVGDSTDRTEITISDCTANDNQTGNGIPSNGLDFAAASQIPVHHVHVKNCQFHRNTHNGIDLTGARNSTFSGISCKANQDDGVFVSVGYDLVFDGMQLEGNEDYGIRADFIKRCTIQNSTINGSTDDAFTGDPADMTSTKQTDYGIRILSNSSENKILNCNFYRPAFRDIWSQASNTTIERCTFVKPLSGAVLVDTGNDNLIRYNRFLDHTGNSTTVGAITLTSGVRHVVERNYIKQVSATASRPAIYLGSGATAYVNRNRIENYPTDGGFHNIAGTVFSEPINPRDYNADPTGVANSRQALLDADAAATKVGAALEFTRGTYKVSTATTLANTCLFRPQASIKPDNTIVVTLNGRLEAVGHPLDTSAGGSFVLGATTGSRTNQYQADNWNSVDASSPTPSVRGISFLRITAAGTFTDFTNAVEGQRLEIFTTVSGVIIEHGTGLRLDGGTNFTSGTNGGSLSLRRIGGTWYQRDKSVTYP